MDELGRDRAVRERDALVEDGERVAEAAVGLQRDELERLVVGRHIHLPADVAQPRLNLADGDAAEVETLAARLDRRRDGVRLRRREDEDEVRGRLFERLQERVERFLRQHVHFVDDVDGVAALGGRVLRAVAEVTDFVDAAVRCGVDLVDVDGRAVLDGAAALACAARLGAVGVLAVQRHREDLRRARLARAARPREEVRMAEPACRDGLRERARHVLLADEVREPARPPFSVKRNIRHGERSLSSKKEAVAIEMQRPPPLLPFERRTTAPRHPCGTWRISLNAASFRT